MGIITCCAPPVGTQGGKAAQIPSCARSHPDSDPTQAMEVDTFGKGVTAALSNNTADEIDRSSSKRRKIEEPDDSHLPLHMQTVKSFDELLRLIRAYFNGRGNITGLLPVGIESRGVDDWDEPNVAEGAPKFTDYLDAHRKFTSTGYRDRTVQLHMYKPQRSIGNYIATDLDGTTYFNPGPEVRNTGLLREFMCGSGGFFKKSSLELMDYMLPIEIPTIEEFRGKLERILDATGMREDLTGLTLDQLAASGAGVGGDLFTDPEGYSEITVLDEDLVDGEIGLSAYERIIRNNYHIATTLLRRNQVRFQYYSDRGDHEGMRRFMSQLGSDMKLMLNGRSTEGIPKVHIPPIACPQSEIHSRRRIAGVQQAVQGEHTVVDRASERGGRCSRVHYKRPEDLLRTDQEAPLHRSVVDVCARLYKCFPMPQVYDPAAKGVPPPLQHALLGHPQSERGVVLHDAFWPE